MAPLKGYREVSGMPLHSHPRPPVSPHALNAPDGDTMWTNLGDWSATTQYVAAARALAARVGAAAELGPDDVVVDYACGYGDSLLLWIQRFGVRRVVGVEPDPIVCRTIRTRVARWGLGDRIRVVEDRAELLAPRAADRDATAVVCVDAAYHFASRLAWWRMVADDLPAGARIAATDLVIAGHERAGLRLRLIARAMGIPRENLVAADTLRAALGALGLADVSCSSIGEPVLDGFVRHVAGRAPGVRVTRAALGALRRRGLVDYVLVGARCQSG